MIIIIPKHFDSMLALNNFYKNEYKNQKGGKQHQTYLAFEWHTFACRMVFDESATFARLDSPH